MKFGYVVICPKCGLSGFVTIRNVRSSYIPKRSKVAKAIESTLYSQSIDIQSDKKARTFKIDNYEYWTSGIIRSQSKNDVYIKEIHGPFKETISYKVYTKTYSHLYIGHYNPHEYRVKKLDFDEGSLKFRPNGRKWCYITKNSVISIPATPHNAGFTIKYDDLRKILSS